MRARGAFAVSLADVAGVDQRGKLIPLVPADRILESLRTHVPETAVRPETRDGMAFFPTPAGATWGELEIRFRDGHTVSVRFGEERGVFTLAKDLRRFFRIDEDPIALTEDGKGWRVRFSLRPEC